eukprot:jgi/Mesen1/6909/ME000354S06097
MNEANLKLAEGLVSKSYVRQGGQALQQRHNLVKTLLSQKQLPAEGWDDATIEVLLHDLAMMDSNNFRGAVGMGEREARCFSPLVAARHFRLAHGIGRSGAIDDEQPKAAGSTLVARLTNCLAKDALTHAGLLDVGSVSVLPVATGMALTLTLTALRQSRPSSARFVLWPRIDQKACVKSVLAAGLELAVVPNLMDGDELTTDLDALQREIRRRGGNSILCVLSTTSCFAPRGADRVEEIAKLCAREGVPHVINNAYGVQVREISAAITRAWRRGRVDAVVQSTDKNFLVPVGGSIVAAGKSNPSLVQAVNSVYPGRASVAPLLDVLITLLAMGVSGWRRVLADREALFPYLRSKLSELAASLGERVLHTPRNGISLAMTLCTLDSCHPGTTPPPRVEAPNRNSSPRAVEELMDATGCSFDGLKELHATTPSCDNAAESGPGPGAADLMRPVSASSERAGVTGAVEATALATLGDRRESASGLCRGADGKKENEERGGGGEAGGVSGRGVWEEAAEGRAGKQAEAPALLQHGSGHPPPPPPLDPQRSEAHALTYLGSLLFSRLVSGCRVIPRGEHKKVGSFDAIGWGSSHSSYASHPLDAL